MGHNIHTYCTRRRRGAGLSGAEAGSQVGTYYTYILIIFLRRTDAEEYRKKKKERGMCRTYTHRNTWGPLINSARAALPTSNIPMLWGVY